MKKIKLGIIGLSPGNGHPYSWSAIFNGYNPRYMNECPFPVIPQYLAQQKFPQDSIKTATVTHIWTQDTSTSKQIAKACNIENVVDNYTDLIGAVDGVLLARDDYQNHHAMSKPFIEAGLPIYIDKPLAITTQDAKNMLSQEKFKNQIFTCSALSFAQELQLTKKDLSDLGNIEYIDACVMKDWNKYAIHIIEPVLKNLLRHKLITAKEQYSNITITSNGNNKIVSYHWESGLITSFCSLGHTQCPIKIRFFGKKNYKEVTFKDTFSAFKKALNTFVQSSFLNRPNPHAQTLTMRTIKMIEDGNIHE
jgi:hypothetical protein